MNVQPFKVVPTQEVLDFAAEKNATDLRVDLYTPNDGVIWGAYDEDYMLVGRCDATGWEVKDLKVTVK